MFQERFTLWEGKAPLSIPGKEVPTIDYYSAEERISDAAVVIFPGGGYTHRAKHEGDGYATYLNSVGIDCFVVNYRVNPYKFPAPLLDARRAVRLVLSTGEYKDVIVMGSSAGGHLAALVSTFKGPIEGEGADELDGIEVKISGQVLCYPVLDVQGNARSFDNLLKDISPAAIKAVTPMYLADEDTPPVFLWHTSSDGTVEIGNSYRYAERLSELGVPVEMHVYPCGNHGLGLADDDAHGEPYVRDWVLHLDNWMMLGGFIPMSEE